MRSVWGAIGVLLLTLGLGCQPAARNPSSLWLDYLQSETNLVLVDHEPPPF